jgi:hypothetical protein
MRVITGNSRGRPATLCQWYHLQLQPACSALPWEGGPGYREGFRTWRMNFL